MGGLFGGGKAPQAQKQQPAGALNIQTSIFGSVYPIAYGKNRLPVNLIHYFNFKAIPHTQKQKTGGKGGPKATSTTTYTYQVSCAMGFAVGGIAGVGTLWKNKEKHTLASLGMTLFTGGAGQTVWAHLASARPAEAVPYANLAYLAHPAFNLGDSPSLPNINVEYKGLVPYNPGTIDDALASDIVYDYLTDPRHGAGFGAFLADLDAGSNSFRKYCLARGLFLSPFENNQRQAGAFVKDIAEMCNSALVWREGKLNIIPYGDAAITGNGATYTPDLTPKYALTLRDFLFEKGQPPIRHKAKPQEQAYNHLRMEYNARSNDYNPLIVEVKDQADIDENGLRTKAVTQYKGVTLDNVARDILQLQLQRDLFVVNTYAFRLGVRHSLLEPMDLVTLDDTLAGEVGLGLQGQLVRIIDVVEQDDAIDVVAEEMNVGTANAPLYNTQTPGGYNQDFNVSPGPVEDPMLMNAPGLLTPTGYELWVAVAGTNADLWGGAVVWISDDNVNYRRVGEVTGPARYGALTTTMSAGSNDYDTTTTARVQLYQGALLSGSQLDCDEWRNICFVGGEWVSYRDAVLVSGTTFDLDTFRRAGYGSIRASHAASSSFAAIDEAIFRLPYEKGNVGKTVYLKFQSFNVFGGGMEDLSACVAYPHEFGASELTAPSDFILDEVNRTFYQPTAPVAIAIGDYWYNTITKVLARWNGASWDTLTANAADLIIPKIRNPSFEQDLLDWGDSVGAGLTGWGVEAGGYTGNRAYKRGGTTGFTGLGNLASMQVSPGEVLVFSVMARAIGSPVGTIGFGCAFFDAAGGYLGGDWPTGSHNAAQVGTAWKSLRRVETAPANAVSARFCVAVQGYTGVGEWQFDNCDVERLAASLDEVPNGPTYSRMFGSYLQGGAPFSLSFGDNMVQNGRFEDATYSLALGAHASNANLAPGWIVDGVGSDLQVGIETNAIFAGSARSIYFRNAGGFSLANTALSFGAVQTKQRFPVQPGDRYILTCRYDLSFANARPTNVSTEADFGVYYFDKNNAYIGADVVGVSGGSQAASNVSKVEPASLPFTVPANAATFAVVLRAYVANNTGGSYVTAAGLVQARFDDITCRKVELVSAGAGNHLRNTDFNNNLTHWFNFTSKFDNDVEGNQIRVGSLADGAFAFPYQDVDGGWDVGTYVTFSGAAIQIGGVLANGSRYQPYIEFYNVSSLISTNYGTNILPDTTAALSFTKFATTARIPANTTKVRVGFVIEGPQTLFAMIQPKLEKGPYATPYVTGSDGTYAQGLVRPGSNRRVGDQRNLVQSIVTAYGSARTATALSATSAGAVTVNAHTVRYGGTSVTYNAVASAVTGLTQNVKYVIYCTDTNFEGGTRTYSAATSIDAVMNLGDGIVVVGEVTIPTSGSSSGGGGGGFECVDVDMLLADGGRAGDVNPGDMIPCWDENAENPGEVYVEVQSAQHSPLTPCMELTSRSGVKVVASETTPFTLRDGTICWMPDMLGEEVLVRGPDGRMGWEPVRDLRSIGLRTVAHIRVNQKCYFAGSQPGYTIATHNPIAKP